MCVCVCVFVCVCGYNLHITQRVLSKDTERATDISFSQAQHAYKNIL